MMHSQGLLLLLHPGSTPGFALPLGGFRCQLTGGNITPKTQEKNPYFLPGLTPASPLCYVCRLKVAAALPLPGAGGGQARIPRAGALLSTWLQQRTAELSHVFTLIPVSLREDQHTLPKVLPLTVCPPCLQCPGKQWAPSCASAQTKHCPPGLVWDLHTPVPLPRRPSMSAGQPVGCWAPKPAEPLCVPIREHC